MTHKEAAEIALAYQRCAWAVERFETQKRRARYLEERADYWRSESERLWREAK